MAGTPRDPKCALLFFISLILAILPPAVFGQPRPAKGGGGGGGEGRGGQPTQPRLAVAWNTPITCICIPMSFAFLCIFVCGIFQGLCVQFCLIVVLFLDSLFFYFLPVGSMLWFDCGGGGTLKYVAKFCGHYTGIAFIHFLWPLIGVLWILGGRDADAP